MMKPTWETEDGAVKLFLGDCLEVLPGLEDESVNMIWTDPPYGHNNLDGDLQSARVRDGVKGARVREAEPIANDGAEDMRAVVDGMLSEAARILNSDCCCCCCCCCCGGGGPRPTFAWTAERMDTGGLSFFHATVWDKSARGNGIGWRYRRNYEFVMIAHRRGGRLLWADSRAVPNIVRHMPVLDRQHPNEKPADMVADFIEWHAAAGMTVCDPFMGSGTTGVACVRTDRRFIGIENEPKYFWIAVERIEAELTRHPLIEAKPRVRQQSLIGDDT